MPAPRPRSTRQAQAPREFALGRVARPSIVSLCWRWRYELGTVAALTGLVSRVGLVPAASCVLALVAAIALWPALRRVFMARAWCVITPHRVRTGCAQAWIHSRDGKIPVVLWTSRIRNGQRVLLWCRAGTSAEDFTWGAHLIAAACWAREIQVTRHERFAHIVILDVIRRAESGRPALPRPVPPLLKATPDRQGRARGDGRAQLPAGGEPAPGSPRRAA
jgi:hypothetical protein